MGFKVHIQPSGHVIEVRDGETILEAALREGFNLAYSCRNGACGTCKGTILEGRVDYGQYEPKALSAEERASGHALFCRATPLTDLVVLARELGAARGIVIKTMPCRVVRKEQLAHDVMALYLKRPQAELFRFLAGQYIDILLKEGRRRSFSLANAPEHDELLELHVRRVASGHFSEHVFTTMPEKTLLRIEGPLGTFFMDEQSERPALLVAGGTGFAPLKGMLEHAFASGKGRPVHLFWGVRAVRDLYMNDLAQGWERSYPPFRYTPVLSEPQPEDVWSGARGYVHDEVVRHYPDLSGYDVYASGPPAMVQSAHTLFCAHGLPSDRLFSDSFEYAKDAR